MVIEYGNDKRYTFSVGHIYIYDYNIRRMQQYDHRNDYSKPRLHCTDKP